MIFFNFFHYNLFKLLCAILLLNLLTFTSSCAKQDNNTDNTSTINYQSGPRGLYPQNFNVVGNKIVDESNKEVVFRGVSIECPPVLARSFEDKATGGIFYFDKLLEWNENIFSTLSNWGATIVRLPVYPSAWRTLGDAYCLSKIDEAILWASNHNLYVIIEWHSVGYPPSDDYETNFSDNYGQLYPTSPTEMNTFWNVISKRYKDNKVVAFYELFNEPTFPDFETNNNYIPSITLWNEWKALADNIVTTIRNNDPNTPIIVGCPNWSYDLQYVMQAPIQDSKIIYTAHVYPGVNSSISWDNAFGNLKSTYPIFATEIGYSLGNSNDQPYYINDYVQENGNVTKDKYDEAIKHYLENKNISWAAWNFSPYVGPTLLSSKDFQTNSVGEFFKTWLEKAKQ
jgi:aryl-phospho-beta-D-glucosidase BglC (GH1 family)